jgi:hypothetical protein
MSKVDKDTLIKHHFWILCGVLLPLVLTCLIVLGVAVGSKVKAKRAEFEKAKTDVSKFGDVKNQSFIDPLMKQYDEFNGLKNEVWYDAWWLQNYPTPFMTWPAGFLETQMQTAHFGDYIGSEERNSYARKYYNTQIPADGSVFTEIIKPVEFRDGWQRVIRTHQWDPDNKPATVEELWLAQEDLWVQRDLLYIVRDALGYVGNLWPVPASEPIVGLAGGAALAYDPDFVQPLEAAQAAAKDAPKDALFYQVYRGANWEVALVIEKKGDVPVISTKSTIKNINTMRRTLPTAHVRFQPFHANERGENETGDLVFTAQVERLGWNEVANVKEEVPFKLFNTERPVRLREDFDWQSSPIKRIDQILMGAPALSSRMVGNALKAKTISNDKPGTTPAPSAPATTTTTGTGEKQQAPAETAATNNGLDRLRYIDYSQQVRRIPVALTLIVDEAHVQDVLTAVANSRLNVQIMQSRYQHVSGIQPASAGRSADEDPNLVELRVYGIASLYERFDVPQQAAAK